MSEKENRKSPRGKKDKGTKYVEHSSQYKNAVDNTTIDENLQPNTTCPTPPLKLKLRLRNDREANIEEEKSEKIIPKIHLSIKKLPPTIPIESMEPKQPAKRGRKKKTPNQHSLDKSNSSFPSVGQSPFASLATALRSTSVLSAPKYPTSRHPPLRYPISPLSTPSLNFGSMESEEDRFVRVSLMETFADLWSTLRKPAQYEALNPDDLTKAVLPYWLLLAPMDFKAEAINKRCTTKTIDQIQQEFENLKIRLKALHIQEKSKPIQTELFVLEQRLCLEEEKYLFAKLRSEYNQKLSLMMSLNNELKATNNIQSTDQKNNMDDLKKKQIDWASGSGIKIIRGP